MKTLQLTDEELDLIDSALVSYTLNENPRRINCTIISESSKKKFDDECDMITSIRDKIFEAQDE